jgi:Family of unknown function (DUF6209)
VEETRPVQYDDLNRSIIRFLPGWQQVQEGEVKRSGTLVIEYDPSRLENCHMNWRGADIWDITAYAFFNPGGQLYQGSVLREVRNGGMVIAHAPQSWEVSVPDDATQVQIWFRTWYQLSSYCEGWDSRFGQNYTFTVALPPG